MLIQQSLIIILCFICYYVGRHWISLRIKNTVLAVVWQRLIGCALLLIPSLLYFSFDSLVTSKAATGKSIMFIIVFSFLAVVVNGLRKRTEKDLQAYPHIRVTHWTPRITIINTLSWMFYLLPYEYVFRGTLLNASLSSMETWTAFVFNGAMYALAHAPQGPRETIVSFPFGILLSFISMTTGNFWSAYFIHVTLALSNDYFAIRHNTKMNFISTLTRELWPSTKKITH
jgi:membrane protease YdiL (CAAX protease family)